MFNCLFFHLANLLDSKSKMWFFANIVNCFNFLYDFSINKSEMHCFCYSASFIFSAQSFKWLLFLLFLMYSRFQICTYACIFSIDIHVILIVNQCLYEGTTVSCYYPFKKYEELEIFFLQFAVQAWCHLSPCLNDHSYSWVVNLLQAGSKQKCRKWMS